ncbi:MAG: hypothetical protein WCJ81_01535 [bacterium]
MKKIALLLGILSIVWALQSCNTNAGSRTAAVSDSMAVQNVKQAIENKNIAIARSFETTHVSIDLEPGQKFLAIQFVEWSGRPIITTRNRYKGERIDTFHVSYVWDNEPLYYRINERK